MGRCRNLFLFFPFMFIITKRRGWGKRNISIRDSKSLPPFCTAAAAMLYRSGRDASSSFEASLGAVRSLG